MSILSSANASNAAFPLTYGVELEFSFLIDQRAIESETGSTDFLKSLRKGAIDQELPPTAKRSARDRHILRRIYQFSKILEQKNIQHNVLNEYGNYSGIGFADWNLTYDSSADLDSHRYEHVSGWTHGLIIPEEDAKGQPVSIRPWEHAGLEFVSKILPAPALTRADRHGYTSLAEIDTVMRCFERPSPNQPYTLPYMSIMEVENSGLHVHVGTLPIPDPADPSKQIKKFMSLDLVKHIAYLVLAYEDVITSLHHSERRGYPLTKTAYMARTNRLGLLNTDHNCAQIHAEDLEALRTKLFHTNEIATMDDLILFMDHLGPGSDLNDDTAKRRYKMVNFENLGQDRIGTVEFRQHHGTQDPEEIKQWVVFVTQLVHLAARRCAAAAAIDEGSQSGRAIRRAMAELWRTPAHIRRRSARTITPVTRERNLATSLRSLLGEIRLHRSRETYWLARQERMQAADREYRLTRRGAHTCALCSRTRLSERLAAKYARLDRLYVENGGERPRNILRFSAATVAAARALGTPAPDTDNSTDSSSTSSSSSESRSGSNAAASGASPAQRVETDTNEDAVMSDADSEEGEALEQPVVGRSERLARLTQHRSRRQQRRR